MAQTKNDKKNEEPILKKCYTCGQMQMKNKSLKALKCPHTKRNQYYCDDFCFKWRYFDPKFEPKRYERKLFGDVKW